MLIARPCDEKGHAIGHLDDYVSEVMFGASWWAIVAFTRELGQSQWYKKVGRRSRILLPVACGAFPSSVCIVGSKYEAEKEYYPTWSVEDSSRLSWYNRFTRSIRCRPEKCYDCCIISRSLYYAHRQQSKCYFTQDNQR